MTTASSRLGDIINKHHANLLDQWLSSLLARLGRRDAGAENELRQQASRFLSLVGKSLQTSGSTETESAIWEDVRQLLSDISAIRVRQGYNSVETATFVFSLKSPVIEYLRQELESEPDGLINAILMANELFDKLGLVTVDAYQRTREQVILRQQQDLLELSTPVVELWDNVLALPLIGTLDSARTQVVMESLLQKIVDTGAYIAIIDITGVPTVDTLVAQHLLKTVAAARLMGADCIISGIRPQIAQTIVHLGVNLEDVTTKATLADAFRVALKRTGSSISSSPLRD